MTPSAKKTYKKILVFPDFNSSGIWNGDDPHKIMIEYEDLGLPDHLIQEFRHWIYDLYDKGYKKPKYAGLTRKAIKPVYETGLRLARIIKEMFPDSEVEYWSERFNHKIKKMKIL